MIDETTEKFLMLWLTSNKEQTSRERKINLAQFGAELSQAQPGLEGIWLE